MAKSKANIFDTTERNLATVCKALGHPARIKIIKLLLANNHQTCQNIVDQLPLSQSTVSQHLRELRQCEILNAKHDKTAVIYSVNKDNLNSAQKMFADLFYSKVVLQPSLF